VLEQAVTQLSEWTRALPVGGELTMAINMSVRQIRDPGLTEDIREVISRAGIAPERIVLEITETMLVHDPAEVALVLQALKDLGVRIAIDDFGTGYASMSYLQQLPIDILKVDRSFVTPTHEEVDDGHKLLGAILNLADTLGLQTVAEGIEHRFPRRPAHRRRLRHRPGLPLVAGGQRRRRHRARRRGLDGRGSARIARACPQRGARGRAAAPRTRPGLF